MIFNICRVYFIFSLYFHKNICNWFVKGVTWWLLETVVWKNLRGFFKIFHFLFHRRTKSVGVWIDKVNNDIIFIFGWIIHLILSNNVQRVNKHIFLQRCHRKDYYYYYFIWECLWETWWPSLHPSYSSLAMISYNGNAYVDYNYTMSRSRCLLL